MLKRCERDDLLKREMQCGFQGMMVDLLGYYSKGCADAMEVEEEERQQKSEGERRMEVLKEACQGNSSLLSELEKLKEVVKSRESGTKSEKRDRGVYPN